MKLMKLLHRSIKWVMLVSGLLTCTMFYAVIAPEAVLQSNFGSSLEGSVAQIVVRNWGALIGLMGLLLVYGAFRESVRRTALLIAGTSKVVFIGLVLSFGQQFLQFQVGISVVVDSIMVLLFLTYLVTNPEVVISSATEAREATGLSQSQFANLLGVSVRTLQGWEQGRKQPSGAARTLLAIARTNPKAVLAVSAQ